MCSLLILLRLQIRKVTMYMYLVSPYDISLFMTIEIIYVSSSEIKLIHRDMRVISEVKVQCPCGVFLKLPTTQACLASYIRTCSEYFMKSEHQIAFILQMTLKAEILG